MEKWIKIVGGILGIIVMLLGLYFGYLHISKETVEGVVRDGVSNKPIKGVTVVLEDNQFITGDEGKYYFEDMIRPGRYTITSQKDGYEDYAGAVTVKDITNHDIKMSMKGKEEGAQPAGEYKVKITTPTDGQSVDKSLVMEGLFSGIMPREKHLWVVVNPAGSFGWWPQSSEILPGTESGRWMTQVQIGAKDNSGLRFTIAVVLADETAHNIFVAFIEKGKTSGDYPEAALPAGVNNLASISVVRK